MLFEEWIEEGQEWKDWDELGGPYRVQGGWWRFCQVGSSSCEEETLGSGDMLELETIAIVNE